MSVSRGCGEERGEKGEPKPSGPYRFIDRSLAIDRLDRLIQPSTEILKHHVEQRLSANECRERSESRTRRNRAKVEPRSHLALDLAQLPSLLP